MDIRDMFKKELAKESVFKDKNVISPHYIPDMLPFREEQIKEIISTIAPALSGEKINNLFLYGKTGTGKTCTIKKVLENMQDVIKERPELSKVMTTYTNCRNHMTKYRILLKHINEFYNTDFIGYSSSFVYDKLLEFVRKNKVSLIMVLDEIDLIRDIDDTIYALTRANDELGSDAMIAIIGISNNVMFKQKLDPRTKSSLCEKEIVFAPYNANELKKILEDRAKKGLKENAISDAALSLAAAYVAQESGDARTALLLLQRAGEIADEKNKSIIEESEIKEAKKKVEKDVLLNMVSTLPDQLQYVLYAISTLTINKKKLVLNFNEEEVLYSGEVYKEYNKIAKMQGKQAVSSKWFKQYLDELDTYGLIFTTISGKGVRGNTTLIKLGVDAKILIDVLKPKLAV